MWAVIVTNQGTPVQFTLVDTQDDLDELVKQARANWLLVYDKTASVLAGPRTSPGAPLKTVPVFVDDLKNPAYVLTVLSRVKVAGVLKSPKPWQFCPECGCSWLNHLEGQANLDVVDWEPRPCTECDCKKALNL